MVERLSFENFLISVVFEVLWVGVIVRCLVYVDRVLGVNWFEVSSWKFLVILLNLRMCFSGLFFLVNLVLVSMNLMVVVGFL